MSYLERVSKWLVALVCTLVVVSTGLSAKEYTQEGEFVAHLKLSSSSGSQRISGLLIAPRWVLTLKAPVEAALQRGGRISLELGSKQIYQQTSEEVFTSSRSPLALIKLDNSMKGFIYPALMSTPLYSSEQLPEAVVGGRAAREVFFYPGQVVLGYGDRIRRVDGEVKISNKHGINLGGPWFFDSSRGPVVFAISQGGEEAVQIGYSQVRNWIQRTVVKHSDDQLKWLGKHRVLTN